MTMIFDFFFLHGGRGAEGWVGAPDTTEFGFLMLAVLNVCIASAKQQINVLVVCAFEEDFEWEG